MSLNIATVINGREISREEVLAWEARRAVAVLRKLGEVPKSTQLERLREQLIEAKTRLGSEGLLERLKWDIQLSSVASEIFARLSMGKRRFSQTELIVRDGSAERFVNWFMERGFVNDELSMIKGTPDHYILRTSSDGSQEVVETNGGSPLAARFFIDYTDLASLRSEEDSTCLHQLSGVARSGHGTPIGVVRHQFYQSGKGFRAKLLVEFPLLIIPGIVSGHQWHLASEFSNWIEAAHE